MSVKAGPEQVSTLEVAGFSSAVEGLMAYPLLQVRVSFLSLATVVVVAVLELVTAACEQDWEQVVVRAVPPVVQVRTLVVAGLRSAVDGSMAYPLLQVTVRVFPSTTVLAAVTSEFAMIATEQADE